jgi:hypothetical protein
MLQLQHIEPIQHAVLEVILATASSLHIHFRTGRKAEHDVHP